MRAQYFVQSDRTCHNKIRDKFIESIKPIIGVHATENTDYARGVPKQLNTVIYVDNELLAVGNVLWRNRIYSDMEITKKNLYDHLVRWHEKNPDIPAFVIWGFGDKLDVRAWQFTPNEKYEPRTGGRYDRGDDLDVERVIAIPFSKLELPKQIWRRAGILPETA